MKWWLMKAKLSQLRERITIKIAWVLPRSVVYWAAIRVGASATQGEYGNESPSSLLFMDALKRWEA